MKIESKKGFIDPLSLTKLSNMLLRARVVVEGFIAGLHQSPFRGFSLEFAQHREYSPGDELRYLDWKVFGRTDRYYIRQYQEETNLKAYIMLDTSGSMGYSSSKHLSKVQYGAYLSACLSYLMLKQQDSVGFLTFDKKINILIPPRSSREHFSLILEKLEDIGSNNETDINQSVRELGQYVRKRGLIILISDLLGDPDLIIRSLKYFRFKKNEVIVFHILDPSELTLSFQDYYIFQDMETESTITCDPRVIKKSYKEIMDRLIETYKFASRASGIDYYLMETSLPFDVALGNYLAKRNKMRI